MARKGRDTLKLFFQRGALPSADHFGDFIDSTVNQVDDGFKKTAEFGLEISSLGTFDSLISFSAKTARRKRSGRSATTKNGTSCCSGNWMTRGSR